MDFQYKNLKEKLEHVEVTDAEVDRQIERLRQQTPAITVITDRPSTLGDELVLDYAGTCGGVAFEGGSAAVRLFPALKSSFWARTRATT